MLTTILVDILPQMYEQAGYAIQPVPAKPQDTENPDAITVVRGFGTEIPDRPLISVVRTGGSPQGIWWVGNTGMTDNGEAFHLTYWHDQVTITWEVPSAEGGEVFLDDLIGVFEVAMTSNYNTLVLPPPHGFGLYDPRWSISGVHTKLTAPSGHLLYTTQGNFTATMPVPAGTSTYSSAPKALRFELTLEPVASL